VCVCARVLVVCACVCLCLLSSCTSSNMPQQGISISRGRGETTPQFPTDLSGLAPPHANSPCMTPPMRPLSIPPPPPPLVCCMGDGAAAKQPGRNLRLGRFLGPSPPSTFPLSHSIDIPRYRNDSCVQQLEPCPSPD